MGHQSDAQVAGRRVLPSSAPVPSLRNEEFGFRVQLFGFRV